MILLHNYKFCFIHTQMPFGVLWIKPLSVPRAAQWINDSVNREVDSEWIEKTDDSFKDSKCLHGG